VGELKPPKEAGPPSETLVSFSFPGKQYCNGHLRMQSTGRCLRAIAGGRKDVMDGKHGMDTILTAYIWDTFLYAKNSKHSFCNYKNIVAE
jgi:hypothetical protein